MQLRNKLSLYKLLHKLHCVYNKILWNSQRKQLFHTGTNIRVSGLPTIHCPEYVSIGNDCFIGEEVRIEAWDFYSGRRYNPKIIIGDNVTITERCYLSCIDCITISDHVLLGRDVFISDNSHGDFEDIEFPPIQRTLKSKGPIVIEKNVWIGRGSTVLSGVTIGENTIIGAHSLVNRSIPSNCMAAGCPARIIKQKTNRTMTE